MQDVIADSLSRAQTCVGNADRTGGSPGHYFGRCRNLQRYVVLRSPARKEMGIRIAFGANRRDVAGLASRKPAVWGASVQYWGAPSQP
jgi:hypothetical protein